MVPEWLSGLGSGVYNWASGNPMEALSLGIGAAGTGMGIYNQIQQGKQFKRAQEDYMRAMQERQRLAESFSRMSPSAFAPDFSKNYLQSAYFRPAATFMAERGQSDGGAFRQALADAAVKAEGDRLQLGNQIYQSRLGALGFGPIAGPRQTLPPSGSVGAFGGALQNLMLMRAMQGRNQRPAAPTPQGPMGAAYGGIGGDPEYGYNFNYPDEYQYTDMSVPNFQLQGNFRAPAGAGDQRYSLKDFSPYDSSMGEAMSSWTAMPDYSGTY